MYWLLPKLIFDVPGHSPQHVAVLCTVSLTYTGAYTIVHIGLYVDRIPQAFSALSLACIVATDI